MSMHMSTTSCQQAGKTYEPADLNMHARRAAAHLGQISSDQDGLPALDIPVDCSTLHVSPQKTGAQQC